MITEHQKSRSQSDRGSSTKSGQWNFLKDKLEIGKLGHAYLLSGRDIESVQIFAKDFVKFINCTSLNFNSCENKDKDKKHCGECQNCKMIDRGVFPDFKVIKSENSKSSVENEKDMMSIDIGQIREVQSFLALKSFYGGFSAEGGSAHGGKAVIIENADRMTTEAQNCLLKSLEEPKGRTIIFLISSKKELLLNTISSRCQEIKFIDYLSNLEVDEELNNLLKVIDLDLAEKFRYAKSVNLEGDNFNRILNKLQRYFRDLILIEIGVITNSQFKKEGRSVKKLKKIIELIDNIEYQSNIYNINNKLALEVILMEI